MIQRFFLVTISFLMLISSGCQDAVEGDSEFQKEKGDPSQFKIEDGKQQTPEL